MIEALQQRSYLSGDVSIRVISFPRTDPGTQRAEQDVRLYLDMNRNGKIDSQDKSVVTDPAGQARFIGISEGTYRLLLKPLDYPFIYTESFNRSVQIRSGIETSETISLIRDIPAQNSVSGFVFFDKDRSGTPEDRLGDGDTGVQGVRVYLDTNGNGKRDAKELSTFTDEMGGYTLTGMRVDQMRATQRISTPSGYANTTPTALARTSDLEPSMSFGLFKQEATATLAFRITTLLFGTLTPPTRVYLDLNRDGKWNKGEPRQMTGEGGVATFRVLPGKYRMRVSVPTDLKSDRRYVEVKVGDRESRSRVFNLTGAQSAYVAFYYDADRDSVRDGGEPLLRFYNSSYLYCFSSNHTGWQSERGSAANGTIRFDGLFGSARLAYEAYDPEVSFFWTEFADIDPNGDSQRPTEIAIADVPNSWFGTYPELADFAL